MNYLEYDSCFPFLWQMQILACSVSICVYISLSWARAACLLLLYRSQHYNSAFGFIWKTVREQCAKGLCKYNFRVRGVLLRAVDCIIKEGETLPRTPLSMQKVHNEKRAPVNAEALPRSPFWPHAIEFLFSPKFFLCCMWQLLKINYMRIVILAIIARCESCLFSCHNHSSLRVMNAC